MYSDTSRSCCGMAEGYDLDRLTASQLKDTEGQMSESFVIVTTVPSQKAAIRALKARKFKVLAKFKNWNTGNLVTLWGKKLDN